MWDSLLEFVLFAALTGYVTNALTDRYWLCAFGGAATCSALSLLYEAWLANWHVNIGWVPPMFQLGMMVAVPVIALTGLPWLLARRLRDRWVKYPPAKMALQKIAFWFAIIYISVVPLMAVLIIGLPLLGFSSSRLTIGIGVSCALLQFSMRRVSETLTPLTDSLLCENKHA